MRKWKIPKFQENWYSGFYSACENPNSFFLQRSWGRLQKKLAWRGLVKPITSVKMIKIVHANVLKTLITYMKIAKMFSNDYYNMSFEKSAFNILLGMRKIKIIQIS